jgi:hypothetical protein
VTYLLPWVGLGHFDARIIVTAKYNRGSEAKPSGFGSNPENEFMAYETKYPQTPETQQKLIKWGWCDTLGRPLYWKTVYEDRRERRILTT